MSARSPERGDDDATHGTWDPDKSPTVTGPAFAPWETGAPAEIGPYKVEREIGRGGMGVVFLARDAHLDRRVAIKVLPAERAGHEGRVRFEREARAAAQLDHPNIATIYAFGNASDTYYIAMEYIEGRTLADVFRDGRMALDRSLDIARQLADGLARAHARKIIHRDLKPRNVMLTPDDHVKILDFGLAKIVASVTKGTSRTHGGGTEAGGTRSGTDVSTDKQVIGTPGYMSPEQIRGERVDQRADIFSFGIILYEMLTGVAPFEGDSRSVVMTSILRDTPVPAAEHNPAIPLDLERLVQSCLSKDRRVRIAPVRRIREELRQVVERLEHSAADDTPSIAVLPFTNRGAEPDDEFFIYGMAEDIISSLSRLGGVRLASRTSCFAFKDSTDDIRWIGRQLRVGSVLAGSIERAGERMVIDARLVNTADGRTIWSERYEDDAHDVLAVQDRVAGSITGSLRVVLSK